MSQDGYCGDFHSKQGGVSEHEKDCKCARCLVERIFYGKK